MSGRTLHWREGRLITNRKTDRRNPRANKRWTLTFELPGLLALATLPEHYANSCHITIGPGGNVEIVGPTERDVLECAVLQLREMAYDGLAQPIDIHISNEKVAPQSPPHSLEGRPRVVKLAWDGTTAQLIQRHASRPVLTRAEERRRGDRWLQSGGPPQPTSPWKHR